MAPMDLHPLDLLTASDTVVDAVMKKAKLGSEVPGHRYVRRTGSPGHYRYLYPEGGAPPAPPGGSRQPRRGRHLPLDRKQVVALLQHGTFSIVSAGRNPADPEEDKLPVDHPRFHERHERLRKRLEDSGYDYTEATGHYEGVEPNFMVWHRADPKRARPAKRQFVVHHEDHPHEFQAMRDLGKEHNQDSVLHYSRGKAEVHHTTGQYAGKFVDFHPGWEEAPDATDYYTEVPLRGGGIFKFRMDPKNFDVKHEFSGAMHKAEVGETIGQTRSGKPIPAGHVKVSPPGWGHREHADAFQAHLGEAIRHRQAGNTPQAEHHYAQADWHAKIHHVMAGRYPRPATGAPMPTQKSDPIALLHDAGLDLCKAEPLGYDDLGKARSGYQRPDHKYIKRTGSPGHYQYEYPGDKAFKPLQTAIKTSPVGWDARHMRAMDKLATHYGLKPASREDQGVGWAYAGDAGVPSIGEEDLSTVAEHVGAGEFKHAHGALSMLAAGAHRGKPGTPKSASAPGGGDGGRASEGVASQIHAFVMGALSKPAGERRKRGDHGYKKIGQWRVHAWPKIEGASSHLHAERGMTQEEYKRVAPLMGVHPGDMEESLNYWNTKNPERPFFLVSNDSERPFRGGEYFADFVDGSATYTAPIQGASVEAVIHQVEQAIAGKGGRTHKKSDSDPLDFFKSGMVRALEGDGIVCCKSCGACSKELAKSEVCPSCGMSPNERVSAKIRKLMDEGKHQKQAVAIALDMQRRGDLDHEDGKSESAKSDLPDLRDPLALIKGEPYTP